MNEQDYCQRQTDKPLFPDAVWSKPERKSQAGKLLIIGGNGLEFAKTQAAYNLALKIGLGECKVVLPKTALKVIGIHPDIEFAPNTSQGSFALEAKADLLGYIDWADTVLLPGELGRSSETAQLIEQIISSTNKRIVLARDALDLLHVDYASLIRRPETTAVLSLAQLQEVFKVVGWPQAIRFQMSLPELVAQLHEFTNQYPVNLVVYFGLNLVAASSGEVVTTRLDNEPESWRLVVATLSATWLTWTQPFEALATSCWQFRD